MSSLPKNRKSYNNYNNNSLKKFPLERYLKNDLTKENNKNNKKKNILNSINSQSKDRLLSKNLNNLNNSVNYIKGNDSFNKKKKENQKNKLHKNGHYNWKLKLLNNIHQSMNNYSPFSPPPNLPIISLNESNPNIAMKATTNPPKIPRITAEIETNAPVANR